MFECMSHGDLEILVAAKEYPTLDPSDHLKRSYAVDPQSREQRTSA